MIPSTVQGKRLDAGSSQGAAVREDSLIGMAGSLGPIQ
jgi:hypothetical protein